MTLLMFLPIVEYFLETLELDAPSIGLVSLGASGLCIVGSFGVEGDDELRTSMNGDDGSGNDLLRVDELVEPSTEPERMELSIGVSKDWSELTLSILVLSNGLGEFAEVFVTLKSTSHLVISPSQTSSLMFSIGM